VGRLEFDVREPRPGQGIDNTPAFAHKALILLDAEKYVGGFAPVGDEYRPLQVLMG
jgi:hypothetical protein